MTAQSNNSSSRLLRGVSLQAIGWALAVTAVGGVAQAETAPAAQAAAAPTEELVVTGYRGALARSAKIKMQSDRIVETVSAEDIGKLPENSIADAIASLPGVTTQRLGGRDNEITIRGFSADYSTTLLNGREQVSTNDNRGVDFDQYPAEVINRVDVYKTPDASLIGQGLAGTVNMQTIRPLEYGKRSLTLGVRGEYADNGKLNSGSQDIGYRVNGAYVGQFDDDKLGIMVGVSHDESPQQYTQFNSWGYTTIADGSYIIGGSKSFNVSSMLKRTAVVGTIEFKPNDNFTSTIDGLYTHFNNTETDRGIEVPLAWGSGTLAPGYTESGGVVTSGTYTNDFGVVRNDANQRKADEYSLGWNGAFKKDGWTVVGDISWSHVNRDELVLETYSGTGLGKSGAPDSFGFTATPDGYVLTHTLNYSDPSVIELTDPQGWGGSKPQDGYYNDRHISDDLKAFRGSVKKDFSNSFFKNAEVGVEYSDRSKSLTANEYFLRLASGAPSEAIPTGALLSPTQSYQGLGPLVSYDPIKMLNSGIYTLDPNGSGDVQVKNYSVTEHVFTAYALVNIDHDFSVARLTGNAGLQFVHTGQDSNGVVSIQSGAGQVANDVAISYNEVLPSLNLALRFPSDFVIRLGAAREMMRPRMIDMRATNEYSLNLNSPQEGEAYLSGSGGNPYLRPWLANAIDGSFEKYFGHDGGYVAVAPFYKHLTTYIVTVSTDLPFPVTLPTGYTQSPAGNSFTVPVNGHGGDMYGVEFAVNAPFKTFVPALEGFGVNGTLSITQSKIVAPDLQTGQLDTALPNYSKYVGNLTAYYEKNGFQVRLNVRYRSDYLGDLSGFGALETYRKALAETIVNAQAGYEFKSGRLKGLTFLFQAQNLTNQAFHTIDQSSKQTIDYQLYGRHYLLGATYKF